MSQIPLFSSKRCNAPPFLLSILYKNSFPFHVFYFITHVIRIFLVVLNIFHTSSKLNAEIFWFSKPFHYIFLLLFRQKAARSVREGFRRQKRRRAACEKDFCKQKRRRAVCEKDFRRQKRRRAACERDSRRQKAVARDVREGIPAGKKRRAACEKEFRRQKSQRAACERGFCRQKRWRAACEKGFCRQKAAACSVRGRARGIPQDKPTPSDIICQRASLFVSFH